MRRVLASETGHDLYKHRKATAARQSRRTLEWRFQAAIHNLLKLHNHWISPATA